MPRPSCCTGPRLERLGTKQLVGLRQRMSLAADTTAALWREFLLLRSRIGPGLGHELFSLQVYPPAYFSRFSAHTEFEKWAAVAVEAGAVLPPGLEALLLPGGRYAVFGHRGGPDTGPATFGYILQEWLPDSGYVLDNRPHFELLGPTYRHGQPDSEEEIWLPVRAAGSRATSHTLIP